MPLSEAPPTGHLPFEPPLTYAPDLAEFWELWQEEKFWACHEALEAVWRGATQPRKRFLNGLIHCAVAIFQHRRGNAVGAARQETRALIKLGPFRPGYEDLPVDELLRGIHQEIMPSLDKLSDPQRVAVHDLALTLNQQFPPSLEEI